MKRKLNKVVRQHGRKFLLFCLGLSISLFLLLFRLTSTAPTLSPTERQSLHGSESIGSILVNSTQIIHGAILWVFNLLISNHELLAARAPSVLIGLVTVLLFVIILRNWYGPRTMYFGFAVLVSSAWFLHVARFAGTEVIYLMAITLLLTIQLGLSKFQSKFMAYSWLLGNLILLTIPGMVWFILLSLFWQRHYLRKLWLSLTPVFHQIIWASLALAGTILIIARGTIVSSNWQAWLGIPHTFDTPLQLLANFGNAFLAILVRGPNNYELWLPRLPILDIFLTIMLVAGVVFYVKHWRSDRSRMLFAYVILGLVLVAINGPVGLSVVMPLIYLVALGGIAYLLRAWAQVFPRNPIAKALGLVIICSLIGLSALYSFRQYFVAWPHNQNVQRIYSVEHSKRG